MSLNNPDIQCIQNLCKTNEKIPTRYSMQKKNLKVCIYTKTKEKKMIHDLKENASRIAGDFASHLFYYIQDARCYS